MTDEEIHEFVHASVHELMDLNHQLQEQFGIHGYKRYHYDMDQENLLFLHSDDSAPSVIAKDPGDRQHFQQVEYMALGVGQLIFS
jgi:hypothetical protein